MLSRKEAIDLLRQRQQARKNRDQDTIHKLDRQISAAVTAKRWPEIRNDSAKPISKAPEPEHSYIKSPPPKNWEG